MKQKFKKSTAALLAVCLSLSIFMGSVSASNLIFQDTLGHWAEDTIKRLAEDGVVSGFPDGFCYPNEIISRSEFASLIARTLEEETEVIDDTAAFTDIAEHWAEDDILMLTQLEIIQADEYQNNEFEPDKPISRIEMVRMLIRALGADSHSDDGICNLNFKDIDLLSEEDKSYLCIGKNHYIINGYPDKTFKPNEDSTRAEAFELIDNQADAKESIQEKSDKDEASSGGGSSYVPAPSYSFELPKTAHIGDEIEITPKSSYVSSVSWTVTEDGAPTTLDKSFEGSLTATGGRITPKKDGSYTLTATAENSRGKTTVAEQIVAVYPVVTADFTLPQTAHTDTEIVVALKTENLGQNQVIWTLEKDGVAVDAKIAITGKLSNTGGTVQFNSKGNYELTAIITDELGRVCTITKNTEVYPILHIDFELPTVTYTDNDIEVRIDESNHALPTVWTLTKDGKTASVSSEIHGNLNSLGGDVRFKTHGQFVLTATMTDYLDREFTHSQSIKVMPVPEYAFTMPSTVHYGADFSVEVATADHMENTTLEWSLSKNGESASYTGALTADGGKLAISEKGTFVLTSVVTDSLGRTSECSQAITVMNTAPVVESVTATPTRTGKDGKLFVDIKTTATDADGDGFELEWQGKTADDYYAVGTHTIKVRAKDTALEYSEWIETTFTITNETPVVTITATPTRTVKDGKFFVDIKTTATDADGDGFELEWQGKTADDYYSVGTHTVQVRAKDVTGAYSNWEQSTFTIADEAPTRPTITRSPNGNSIAPNTPIRITASSTDADGDAITYVWENRPSETAVYALGKHVVRVRAVDSTGAESPWAAIVFFVMDSNGSGGMMLTGPNSTINENGIEGATITNYTFTVPPVSGHSGDDYGRVRGYNVLTNQWEQLSYGTTVNGITFSKNLTAGLYSKLEFYYYTNHQCMYQKSNITYTVNYYFE